MIRSSTTSGKLIFYKFILLLFIPVAIHAQPGSSHPRGIIKPEDVVVLREKINRKPFRAMYESLLAGTEQQIKEQAIRPYDPYADSRLLGKQSYLFLLTGDPKWAKGAWVSAQRILQDSVYFNDPLSRGLTRALLLQKMALAYDFCYAAWSKGQRQQVNDCLFNVMFSVNANMGHSANYAIESNWMGVRYGAVILASYIWDPPATQEGSRTPVQPIRWDATKRLRDHLDKTLFANGWNGESMSYHIYGWTFVGPALLAMKNNLSHFELAEFAPKSINTWHGIATSTVAIRQQGTQGMQADLSDDDLMFSTNGVLGMAFQLYPKEQLPALKWMHDYLIDSVDFHPPTDDGQLFYSILYYPDTLQPQNPAEIGWLTYHDSEQGIVISRNRFRDENDIVSTYNAKATRIKGHSGPDANTFRLIGLGVPWIIGGGRTGLTAGQSNFFPVKEETATKDNKGLGKLQDHCFIEKSSDTYAVGSGSSVGTQGHYRIHYTTFDEACGAAAVIVVKDSSANGKRWRINTPEFNEVQEMENGYRLISPQGESMQVVFVSPEAPLRIERGKLRYGGNTESHNAGIWYEGQVFTHSRYIDVFCEREVTAVISLQTAGRAHPKVVQTTEGNIKVGSKVIKY